MNIDPLDLTRIKNDSVIQPLDAAEQIKRVKEIGKPKNVPRRMLSPSCIFKSPAHYAKLSLMSPKSTYKLLYKFIFELIVQDYQAELRPN